MSRRLLACAAFAAATFGGGLAAVATGGDPIAAALSANLLAHGIRADAVGLSLAGGGSVVARHVVAQSGDARIEIAQVTAPAAGAGNASADDVVVTTPRATYRAKRVELTGTSLTNADLAALFDAKSSASVADRITKLTAAKITIPEATAEGTEGGVKIKKTYRDVTLSDVGGGKMGTVALSGISLTETDGSGAAIMQSTYGAILAHGVDAALLARIEADLRGSDDEPKAKLFDDLSVEGTREFWPKSQMESSTGRVVARAPLARRLAAPIDMPDVGLPPRQRQQRFARVAVNILDAVEIGDLDMSDIRIRDLSGATPTDVTIAKSHVAQPGADRITTITVDGVKSVGRSGTYQIAQIAADNIDLASLRTALRAVADGANTADLAVRRNLTPVMDRLTLRALDADVSDTSAKAADPAAGRMRFHVDGIELTEGKPTNGIPSKFNAKLDHLAFAVPPSDAFKPLAEMGYGKLDLSSRFGFAWNEPGKELSIDDIWFNGVGMGALRLTAGLSNVSNDLFSTDGAAVQAAALGMLLKKFDLRVDNAGLLEKMIARQATDESRSIDEVKQGYVSAAAVGIPILLGNGVAAKAIGAAAAKFVARPKSFHLVATSSVGLGASDMQYLSTPDVLMNKLQVQVNANE